MIFASTLNLIAVLTLAGAQIFLRPFALNLEIRNSKIAAFVSRAIFWTSVGASASALAWKSYLQYVAWASDPLSKLLLPPHQSIGYFLRYVGWQFFAPYVLSFAAAFLFFYLARAYNKRHDGQFFYEDEYWSIALGVFSVGHPQWILYFIAVIAAASAANIFRTLILRRHDKLSLYYFWLPTAAFVILIDKWIAALDIFLKLKV